MLDYISIKNAALIKESEIFFKEGLNILSGETGSGKSMIIDALNFVLGERTGKDFIRHDSDFVSVSAQFSIKDSFDKSEFIEGGIDISDNTILITRILNKSGKTVSKINGVIVTLAMIRSLSEDLIDIHGQHEHQSLLNSNRHIDLLDKLCKDELIDKKIELASLIEKYKENSKKYKGLIVDKDKREKREEELISHIKKIKDSKILEKDENEYKVLEKKLDLLINMEKILIVSNKCASYIYEGDSDNISAYDSMSKALLYLSELSDLDESASLMVSTGEEAYALIEDLGRSLKKYIDRFNIDQSEIEDIEKRLNTIYDIKKNYGQSNLEIAEYLSKAEEEYNRLINSQELIASLNSKKDSIIKSITNICEEITEIRKNKAALVEELVMDNLRDMEMAHCTFKIAITNKKTFSQKGRDEVEFLFSANKGEEVKPLSKIASGGEMSRVMLALKTVLSLDEAIDTFIFDEIDTGVSGRTAQKMAEKMSIISRHHQIITITHLPQIAAMGDWHFKIEKETIDNSTISRVYELDREQRILEIARLITGVELTKSTYKAAEEMVKLANKIKEPRN